uniref:thioredoxin-like n=1 Tax=Myxine glutinosa TaxID=7769 RepID=UPI00358FD860
MMAKIQTIANLGQFQKLIAESGARLVVVKFTARWCGPCQVIHPIYEELSSQHQVVIFCVVDVDAAWDVAEHCEIKAIPTFVFYKNQAEVKRISGANVQMLKQHVESLK